MHSKMSSAICFDLNQAKILSSGNGSNQSEVVSLSHASNVIKTLSTTYNVLEDRYSLVTTRPIPY